MGEPIPVMVRRYRCPHCGRPRASKKATVAHMGRCWENPEARGCKTCRHFQPVSARCCGQPDLNGCYAPMCPPGDACAVGVDLSGRPACGTCHGSGRVNPLGDACPECDGSPEAAEVKPGPIVGCEKWAAREGDTQ